MPYTIKACHTHDINIPVAQLPNMGRVNKNNNKLDGEYHR